MRSFLRLANVAAAPGCSPSCCDEAKCHPLYTYAYCCSTSCYHWGIDFLGEDLATRPAVSGVHCRHYCQAHEACSYWSYLAHVDELPESLRGG